MFIKQLPLRCECSRKSDVRSQFAALCYRIVKNRVEILLITTRRTGRWIIPKGWPIDGLTPADCAAQEAWEEAGVRGQIHDHCLGLFSYNKMMDDDVVLPCVAMVYPLKVKYLENDYPEVGERRRKWVSRKKAAAMVMEPELARILRDFDPRYLK